MPDKQENSNVMGGEASSPVPPGVRALSPSKINTLQCPYRYRKLYVLGERPQGAEAVQLALGTLVHEVAASYVRHCRQERRQTDLNALRDLAGAAWRLRPHTVPQQCEDDWNTFVANLEQTIFDPETIVDAELRMAFSDSWVPLDWTDPNVAFGGMIDVMGIEGKGEDAIAYAIDWTTAAISGVFAAKKDHQLRMYALLVHKALGIDTVRITTKSLRTGATREVQLDAYDHEETERRIRGEAARAGQLLETDIRFEWPAIPNSECGICSLKCPEFDLSKMGDAPLRFDDEGEAKDALNRLVLLDARRKGLMTALKSYVTFHGAVESNGMEAAMRPQERVTYPTGSVYGILAHGLESAEEPWTVLKVDRTALKRKLKKNKDLLVQIEATATVKIGDRFGVKAAGMDDDQGEE